MKTSQAFAAGWVLALGFAGCGGTKTPPASAAQAAPAVAAAPAPTPSPVPAATATPGAVEISLDSPTGVIQKYTEELKSIVEPNVPKSKRNRDSRKDQKIAEKVRQFFDFPALAKMSLGHYWLKVTEPQRQEYSKLFMALIEDSYLRRSRDIIGDYEITYLPEEIRGDQAKVRSRVGRKDADIDIIYDLHKNPKNWMIFNITLDNVDLISNYQSQFNAMISRYGFNGLLERMRKKLKEGDEVTI